MKKIIKKHKNKNQYLLTPKGHWVRDFTRSAHSEDINNFIDEKEFPQLIKNELRIASMHLASIDREHVSAPNVLIVSDGYGFNEKKELLKKLPRNVTVIGTNRSLANWSKDLRMDYFVVNNPFKECMTYFPSINYFPKCIVSSRTNPDFIRRYRLNRGLLYQYSPVKDKVFGSANNSIYTVDDYRNPICAAIGLAYRWGVKKLMLFCCDDVFEGERPGAIQLENGLYMYPQHQIGHGLIDACLYWLKRQEFSKVKVGNCSQGLEYENAEYIKDNDIVKFFNGV